MEGDVTVSPQGFRRYIRNHSTPLNANAASTSNGTPFSNKRRGGRKRKLVESNDDVIDLTPKKLKLPSSHNDTFNDSDVEIIEPEAPTIIDLVADETNSFNALTNVNTSADIATSTNHEEIQNTTNPKNEDGAVSTSIDSSECTEIDPSHATVIAIDTINESETFYIKDSIGGGSLQPPLYDMVSDDSFCFDTPSATPVSSQEYSQRTLVPNADDSVIFVSETMKTPKRIAPAEDFIPINNRGFNRMIRTLRNLPGGRQPQTRSPKNGQIKNPVKKPEKTVSGIKRMVLIDGNNVAYHHARNKGFSVEGIQICLNYFLEKGYDAKAIVPQMRLKRALSTNQDLLEQLDSEGKIVFSPCKNLPNGKSVTSYDDRFILDFAADCDAAVISNDNYRDLSKESKKYRDIISSRVIGFTFLNDIIKFPQDPYGKFGPTLDSILNGKGQK